MKKTLVAKYIHRGRLADGYQSTDEDRVFRGTHGVVHRLNELGFRDTPRLAIPGQEPVRIVAIGCSYVFGYGLAVQETWVSRFADLVESVFSCTTECTNLGVPGASIEYVVRQVTELAEALNPHIVLIAFPQKERVEYWNSPSHPFSVRPGAPRSAHWQTERADIQQAIERLSNRANDFRRLYQAVRTTEAFCHNAGAALLYTYASVTDTPITEVWAPGNGYLNMPYPRLDLAQDQLHPGPKSNSHLALASFARVCASMRANGTGSQRLRTVLGPHAAVVDFSTSDDAHISGSLDQWLSPA